MRRGLDIGLPLLYVLALVVAGLMNNRTMLGGVAVIGLAVLLLYFFVLRSRRSA